MTKKRKLEIEESLKNWTVYWWLKQTTGEGMKEMKSHLIAEGFDEREILEFSKLFTRIDGKE